MDEHDPYAFSDKTYNPHPERYAREFEVAHLRQEIARLQSELRELSEAEEDRLATLEGRLVEWDRRYSYGKGIVGGIFIVCGILGVFVVDFIEQVFDHIFIRNHPP